MNDTVVPVRRLPFFTNSCPKTLMLSSLKILDFSTLLPGPYATMTLADLGADVLRVEAPHRPDLMRAMPPFDGDTSAI